MTQSTVTKEFGLAVIEGAKALRDMADVVMRDCEADPKNEGTSVERACRSAAEGMRLQADVLDGWLKRNAFELRITGADFPPHLRGDGNG